MHDGRYLADFSLALINRTGAYFVCRDILTALPEMFLATRYWRFCFENEPPSLMKRLLGRAMLWELGLQSKYFARNLRHHGDTPTVFFDPLYVLHSRLKREDVVLCHDVGPITHPELFDINTAALYARAYDLIATARPGMVFVSHASRSEFVKRYGNNFRFLEVISLYFRQELLNNRETQCPGVEKPFLLTVGALETRKNYPRVIEAFATSGLGAQGYSYVFAGPRGNAAASIERLARSTPRTRSLGYLSDQHLYWLYRNAEGFVLPSLLEGFGLPALEAASFGLIPLVSNRGAQIEAVGEGAIAVDPTSTTDIAKGMKLLVSMDDAERASRLALIRRHAETLSFERYIKRWAALLSASPAQ